MKERSRSLCHPQYVDRNADPQHHRPSPMRQSRVRQAVTPPAVRARKERNPFSPSSCKRSWNRMDSGSNSVRSRNINARICARQTCAKRNSPEPTWNGRDWKGPSSAKRICTRVICHKRVSREPISREPSWKTATWREPISGMHDCRTRICSVRSAMKRRSTTPSRPGRNRPIHLSTGPFRGGLPRLS